MPIFLLQGFIGDMGFKGATTYIEVNHTGRNDYLTHWFSKCGPRTNGGPQKELLLLFFYYYININLNKNK